MIELSLGQFSGFGVMTAWRASPMFKGKVIYTFTKSIILLYMLYICMQIDRHRCCE